MQRTKVKIDIRMISDFAGMKEEDIKADLTSVHEMVKLNQFTGENVIFLGG
jgi:hypothetical protein